MQPTWWRRDGFFGRLFSGPTRRTQEAADHAALTAALRRAADAESHKGRFLAVLSHELRTPLTPVLAAATAALRDPAFPRAAVPLAELVKHNIEVEAHLIDDLLDVTRITQGKLRVHKEPVDVHEAIRYAFDVCHDDAVAKRITIALHFAADPSYVLGDLARLRQVFWNMIKNAIRFTGEGGTITVATGNTKDGRLWAEVVDDGIGLCGEDLDRIFEAFAQVDDSRDRLSGGLGLGLAIVRGVVEAHGGEVTAESMGLGSGTTFRILLPACTYQPPRVVVIARPMVSPVGVSLLYVEDDLTTLRVMANLLRGEGFSIQTATDYKSALSAVSVTDFDIVVSDIGLPPPHNGHDLMVQIRKLSPKTRGIALTGFGMDSDIAASEASGFDGHLTKPVTFELLLATVRATLGSQDTRPDPSCLAIPAPIVDNAPA
jgi:nitrogen-specific signal transduction histidine kinase/CheY-like chemotaxis protein